MLLLNDGSEIVTLIKQIKHGCCIDNLMQSAASLSFRNQQNSVTISEIDDSSSAAAESVHKTQIRSYRLGALTAC